MMKKQLKKLCALTFAAILAVASVIPAFAAGNSYTIEECDKLYIELPAEMTAVTRGAKADDGYFAQHRLDYNTVMSSFESGNIYLQAMDAADAVTLTLSSIENDESRSIGDYSLLKADELFKVSEKFIDEPDSAVSYTSCTADEPGAPVVWLNFAMTAKDSAGKTFKQYQVTTVHKGKSISITFTRNGTDVTAADYTLLRSIVGTVKFDYNPLLNNTMLLYILAGCAVVIIILIILIIVLIAKSRKRRKKKNNNKILEELAGEYGARPQDNESGYEPEYSGEDDNREEAQAPAEDTYYEPVKAQPVKEEPEYYADESYDDGIVRKYSDEDIERLLGDYEDDENFIDALPEGQAYSEKTESGDSVTEKAGENDSPFEDGELPEEIVEESEDKAEVYETIEPEPKVLPVEPEEEITEDNSEEEIYDEEIAEEFPAEEASVEDTEEEPEEEPSDEDFEEFANDEVLVREESNQDKFKNSSDFFEEAPRKVIGVISSRQIEEAEEYDVIGEVEQKAEKLEKEAPKTGGGFAGAVKKAGTAIKSFFTHCGYFITNVRREIKRSRAKKKRKKAEAERRERARQQRKIRRERQSNGLVQVHSRDDRRPR